MSFRNWLVIVVPLACVLACGEDRSDPVAPALSPVPAQPASVSSEQARVERLARRLAMALGNPSVRSRIRSVLSGSMLREGKLHFQGLLNQNSPQLLRDLAQTSGDGEAEISSDAAAAGSLELYLPVPEHRSRWKGEEGILVATSLKDGDAPVAFDTQGRRLVLDPRTPPSMPVLSLVPAELDFNTAVGPAHAKCTPETCPPTGGPGGGSPPPPTGIWLTQTHINDLHEDWIRGSPEIEAMFMGPTTDTTKMALIACANESASGSRRYNQDNNNWTGNVLIADSAQLERVHAAYPAGTPWNLVRFTVAFWEDDTGRCQIATDVNSWKNKLLAAGAIVLGGTVVLATDWSSPIDQEAWPFIVQLPLALLGLAQTVGGNDDFVGIVVNRTVWNPMHPDDQVTTTQVLLDGGARSGTATIVWR